MSATAADAANTLGWAVILQKSLSLLPPLRYSLIVWYDCRFLFFPHCCRCPDLCCSLSLSLSLQVNDWQLKNARLQPLTRLSDWGPWAKGFGSLLDLNCAIIVLPVSRTLLRMLYNRSTADQGCFARTLRAILVYIPLDQNILFHKIIAYVILFATVGHVSVLLFCTHKQMHATREGTLLGQLGDVQWCSLSPLCKFCYVFPRSLSLSCSGLHMINLAFSWHNTLEIFGETAWITGGVICLWMFFIYTSLCTFNCTLLRAHAAAAAAR